MIRLEQVRGEMLERFERVDRRFAQNEQRLSRIDQRLGELTERIDALRQELLEQLELLVFLTSGLALPAEQITNDPTEAETHGSSARALGAVLDVEP
jgi:recombinational DNA repair ATPase RecF